MNSVKTFALMAAMTALLGLVGLMLGGAQGMIVALVFAAFMNVGSWWFSDTMILRLYGAKEIHSGAVYDMTKALAARANLPMPRVCIIENPQPNAFATGRNPANGAVAVTTGIMQILNARELRGVIAHELAHIKNRDTLTMTITATIAGAIAMMANFALFFGGRRDGPGGMIGTLVIAILFPLAASLVQMAISRVREYSADRDGAQICGDPAALASALQRLEAAAGRIDNTIAENNPSTAHMFIINPLHAHKVDNLFATHPSTQNRVARLNAMVKTSDSPRSSLAGPWGGRPA